MDISRLSTCSIALHKHPLEETLDIIAAAGFRKVDLLARMPHFSLDPAECNPVDLQHLAQGRGLQIANLGTYVGAGFASDDPTVQQREWGAMQRAIDLAAYFGARSIRVRPGDDSPACLDRIVPWFQRSAEYAANYGVCMGFENHGGGISGQPKLCAELSNKVGSRYFGVLYEPCNLMHAGVDYRYALHIMHEHVTHVHLKDGIFTLQGFQHTMLGQGQVDFPWILSQLTAMHYRGDLALEYELQEPPAEAGLPQWYEAGVALLHAAA
ncbi:MAG: sugar phosphate isomerase/epimerase [Anaerolineae bacterium]|jgi:sugar phosphate isomerase/epimerase|nr:sugar phosphate isomerase/epimerase [Anaerolineae bacterium]